MNTLELKNLLIHRISEIDDVAFLKTIKTILDARTDKDILSLTPEQRQDITISRKEIEQGLFISQTDLDMEIDAWLKDE